jgi:Fe-S oxidoreductase
MNCGMCNTVDPILTAIKKETASSRFKVVLAKQGRTNPLFYLATDASMQEAVCPAGVKLNDVFRLARERNIQDGVTTSANEEMQKNFARTGTPYSDLEPEEFHDKPYW